MNSEILQWIGYAGSIIVAISIITTSIVKFRWINMLGSLVFSIYGFLIGAIPVGILNGIIAFVDIYYLIIIYTKKETFETLEIKADESDYLHRFVKFHNKEIQKICPGFVYNPDMNTVSFFILRNMSVAGLFLAHREDGNVLSIGLDYVIPEYRDFKNAKYVYSGLRKDFIDAGYTKIISEGNNAKHRQYLKKLGFKENENGLYTKDLHNNL